MPLFDEWGLRPAGLEGSHENPVLVVPMPAAATARTSEVDAGWHVLRDTDEAAAEGAALDKAPEVAAPEARVSRPEEATRRLTQLDATEAGAPEARASSRKAEAEGSMQPDTPEVASSRATPAAHGAVGRTRGFGQLRLNFEALRKRKGSPSCSDDAYRPLKHRKYIAIDE